MKKSVLYSLLLCLPISAFAINCENPRNTYDAVYCEQKIYQKADDELNRKYKQLMAKLDRQGQQILRSEQRQWIEERDAECTTTSRDVGEVVNTDCMTRKTIERTNFLADRYRECVTTGCMNSRLSE